MQYSLLTLATMLGQTQAQYIPMPFGLAPVPIPQNAGAGSNGANNMGGMYQSSSMAPQMPMSVPTPMASSMSMHAPFQSASYHYHMTPLPSSASHYINMHMSMHKSASASASMSIHVSATPSPSHRAYFGLNHGLHPPHPHEGFAPPADIPRTPDVTSENGASTKHGGYSGGNGNGFTETHGENDSSDGSPPIFSDGSMNAPEESTEQPTPEQPMPEQPTPQESTPEQEPAQFNPEEYLSGEDMPNSSFKPNVPESEHKNQNIAPFPGSAPSQQGQESIAPVDSMAPGTNVAPTHPQKNQGADLGNAFCMGDCYASPDEAKCQQPYVSFYSLLPLKFVCSC